MMKKNKYVIVSNEYRQTLMYLYARSEKEAMRLVKTSGYMAERFHAEKVG